MPVEEDTSLPAGKNACPADAGLLCGEHVIDLAPAKYTIELKPNGIDRTADLPKVIEIHANTVTRLDVKVDTGIR